MGFVKETGLFRSSSAPPHIHTEFCTLSLKQLRNLLYFVSVRKEGRDLQLGIGEGARQREASGNPCTRDSIRVILEISLGCLLTDRLIESCLKHH